MKFLRSAHQVREARELSEAKKDNVGAVKGNAMVFYLRASGVWKTYDDCCSVKAITERVRRSDR